MPGTNMHSAPARWRVRGCRGDSARISSGQTAGRVRSACLPALRVAGGPDLRRSRRPRSDPAATCIFRRLSAFGSDVTDSAQQRLRIRHWPEDRSTRPGLTFSSAARRPITDVMKNAKSGAGTRLAPLLVVAPAVLASGAMVLGHLASSGTLWWDVAWTSAAVSALAGRCSAGGPPRLRTAGHWTMWAVASACWLFGQLGWDLFSIIGSRSRPRPIWPISAGGRSRW